MNRIDISTLVQQAIKEQVAQQVGKQLGSLMAIGGSSKASRVRVQSQEPLTHWVANRQARRVPLFVQRQTGLVHKQDIIEKYGFGATFDVATKTDLKKPKGGKQKLH